MKLKKPSENSNWKLRFVLTLTLMIMMGVFGWWWKDSVYCRQVSITGARFADENVLRELAHIDSNTVFLDIDPYIVEDRVRRHPWVETVKVRRNPNATLSIEVKERTPAMLVIDAEGRPERYLDAAGFQMPFVREAVSDVPLLRGLAETMHPTQPISHDAVLELLKELTAVPPEVDALLSTFEVDGAGGLNVQTSPKPGRGSIHVRLGRGAYLAKLSKLHAFWHQSVLEKKDVDFESIDLRFDSQIITREVALSQ